MWRKHPHSPIFLCMWLSSLGWDAFQEVYNTALLAGAVDSDRSARDLTDKEVRRLLNTHIVWG